MNRSMHQQTTESWINVESPSTTTSSFTDRDLASSMHINEKLLLDAQNDSSRASSKSSHSDSSSPKTPKSPIQTAANLASIWSSRIEVDPPKEWKFPRSIHPTVVVDDDQEDKQIMDKKQMRYVILSNCASFLLGMGIMYLYLRRYLRLKAPYFYSFD